MFDLNTLNDNQKEVVLDYIGPSIVLAGPGSGKTKSMVARTEYMIEQGINSNEIVLFTFTNKAAKEIKERIIFNLGEKAKNIVIGTFHSVCVRILKKYADKIGYSTSFSIFDTADCTEIVKKISKNYNLDYHQAFEYIDRKKRNRISYQQAIREANGFEEKLAGIYRDYQMTLRKNNAMDFNDLIFNTIDLLENNLEVREKLQNRWKYFITDESQDASKDNLRLIELLVGSAHNICFVGDYDQSIYGFRGADISAILDLDKTYPEIRTHFLCQNYRSTQTIVNASKSLIEHNTLTHKDNQLFSDNHKGEPIVFFEEEDSEKEAIRCVKLIKSLTNKTFGLEHKDIAILYRMGYMSRILEKAFLQNGIPYEIVGGVPFCGRKEIKDILSYLKFIYNPFDYEALKRCINIPKRGIGEKKLEELRTYAQTTYSHPIDYITALKEIPVKGKSAENFKNFLNLINKLKEDYELNAEPFDFLNTIIDSTDYKNYIYKNEKKKSDAEERIMNLQELLNIASHFTTIQDFLDEISLNSSNIENDNADSHEKVNLMTLHASKGLEFEAVIIINSSESCCPHYKALSQEEIEEERRLFYVGMTRAKKYLFLTRSKKIFISGRYDFPYESRFINEIDKCYLKRFQ